MKPSERINSIREELIWDDYIKFGGNSYSRAMWQDKCNLDDQYLWRALMKYLDEQWAEK